MSGAAKNRWQESGGKVGAAATAASFLQGGGGSGRFKRQQSGGGAAVSEWQIRRARGAYAGLFLLLVTVWSTILISAIFSLRVNKEGCESCPDGCRCRDSPPAWG